jgi:hypothetical protein
MSNKACARYIESVQNWEDTKYLSRIPNRENIEYMKRT